MKEVEKPESARNTKNVEFHNDENLGAPQISQEVHNEDNVYPVDVKSSDNEMGEEYYQAQVRAGFIRKVYGILSIQLIMTFGTVLLFQLSTIKTFIKLHQHLCANTLIFCSLAFLVLFLVLICNRNLSRTVPYNYYFLFAITLCESLACGIISSIYSFQIVATALALTIITTLAITFYACNTKTDFSYCRMGMFIVFSQVFMIGLIAMIFRIDALYTLYTFLMTIIIGLYLVYDTQLIMGKFGVAYSVDDYIFATLEIYMDIIRLFLLILRIVARYSRRN
jgi:FtsH-binding integral membrane protein